MGQCPFTVMGVAPEPWNQSRKLHWRRRHLAVRPAGHVGDSRWLVMIDCTEGERERLRSLALLEVAASLTVAKPTLDEVAAAVLRATGGQLCWLAVLDTDPPKLLGRAGDDPERMESVERLMLAKAPTSTREAFMRQEPVIYRDIRKIPAAKDFPEIYDTLAQRVAYSVPMLVEGNAVGGLTLLCDEELDDEAVALPFLQAVADQAALAVENSRLIEALKGKAVLEERNRIARELHDSINQVLYGIGLGARTGLKHMEAGKPECAEKALHYIVAQAEAAIVEMRSLICELRPESLEQEGLVGLLGRQLATLQARHQLQVDSTLLEPALPLDSKHALWRVLQEALANVTQHARATSLQLRMEQADGGLRVVVEDNGVGFDPQERRAGHIGLQTMRERVEPLGGTLTIEGSQGQGTRLTVALPI